MMRQNKIIYFICLSILLSPFKALGFDDKDTHPRFTEKAIIGHSSVEAYFRDVLGYKDIVNSTLPYVNENVVMSSASSSQLAEWNTNGWPILELLKAGSASEDTPDCRA